MATTDTVLDCSRLLYILDRSFSLEFLIDTGSEVSVISPTVKNALFILLVYNSVQQISTYGQKFLSLDVGLRRIFPFLFIIADVKKKTILGMEFLSKFNLVVNLKDSLTNFSVKCPKHTSESPGLHVILPSSDTFSFLASDYSCVFQPQLDVPPIKHDVQNYITT